MNKALLPLLYLLIIFSCQPEEEIFTEETGNFLRFSVDTIQFDTVFTERGSITRRFRVSNINDNAINIKTISVSSSSPFTLVVNGLSGKQFEDVGIFGRDSLLVLVEVFIDPTNDNSPFIIRDEIRFESNGSTSALPLEAWGQNANYVEKGTLLCDITWTNELPYVILDTIAVDENCTLQIEAGATIFFDFNAGLFVAGSLIALGTAEQNISFLNSRLEESFQNASGQWKGIFLLEGSTNNQINHAIIRNADFGLRIGTPDDDTIADVTITNSIIENMFLSGVIAFTSDVVMTNTLVDNCRQPAFAGVAGGNYYLNHCTIANFPNGFAREGSSLFISDNIILNNGEVIIEPVAFEALNTIIWGSSEEEITIDNLGGASLDLTFSHSLLRTTITGLDANGNIINQDPQFVNPFDFNFELDTLSPAKDAGRASDVNFDLLGEERDAFPDMGAFERVESN